MSPGRRWSTRSPPTSSSTRFARSGGDVDGAFARAEHVVRGRYGLPRLAAVPLEPRGAVAEHDPGRDLLTVWCSAQDTHRPLAQLSHVLRRAEESIRVIIPDVGGAFGSKGVIGPEVAVVAIAAMDLASAVKWAEDRLENFLAAYQGRGIVGELELALDGAGRMLGLRAALTADLGAYLLTSTAVPPHTAAMLMVGVYDIPAAAVLVRGMATHKVPTGPYRGRGRPEAAYFVERVVDDAARALGIDPVDLRRRNRLDFPHHTPLGFTYDSGDYERCLDTALGLAADAPPPRAGRARGTGVGMYVERAAGQWESADVTVQPSGRVLVRSSASRTARATTSRSPRSSPTASVCRVDDVVMRFSATAPRSVGVGTFGSRSVAVAGSAIALACDDLIAQARTPPAICSAPIGGFSDGVFRAGAESLTWAQIAAAAPAERLPPGRCRLRACAGSPPSWSSPRAPTWPWSRSSAPPGTSRSCASPPSTMPARSSTRCSPTARSSAARRRRSASA